MSTQLDAVLPMVEITIIKRDFDLLRKLATQLKAETQTQLIPYTALFCQEALEYLNKKGHAVELEPTSHYSIKDIRQKAKFFDLSINKLLQSVENVDDLQNDYFINLMRYPQLGYWNVHDNLGIFYDDQKNIVGNSHYAFYLFQDEKMISKPRESMSGHDISGEEMHAFAYDMGRIIGSISTGLARISDFMVADVCADNIALHRQDFNTNRCSSTGNEKYKVVRLFLLHVLSSIGFILYVVRKAIIRESGLLLRFEYITYHYALLRLEGIMTYCNSHKDVVNDFKLIDALNRIDYTNGDGLRKTEFRNCMMHFGLTDNDGCSLIDEDKVDLSVPFCGLVESQFNMTYEDYKSKLEAQLISLYEIIKDYLDFDLLLSTDNG